MTDLNLKFDINALCVAEALTGKKAVEILDEMEAQEGTSLSTLRALVAAGRVYSSPYAKMPFINMVGLADERAAGMLIETVGLNVTAAAVGEALQQFFQTLPRGSAE